jgi:hypothetical protein
MLVGVVRVIRAMIRVVMLVAVMVDAVAVEAGGGGKHNNDDFGGNGPDDAGGSGGGSNDEDVQSVFDFAKLSSDTLLPSFDDALGEID